jgi:glycosyltransferase involved in cell wall biosynthesis
MREQGLLTQLKTCGKVPTEEFDIILINDDSTDEFHYQNVAKEFDCFYIKNAERKGVVGSREIGIENSKTEYFILLDAHMRVYQADWCSKVTGEISNNKRALFCCLTKTLTKEAVPYEKDRLGVGAFIKFNNLSVEWINSDFYTDFEFREIPCVLGASYACNKSYWRHLNGIKGLLAYGFDEQLISLKVWMEGGKCLLINDVIFGHIFRLGIKVPYSTKTHDYYYNKLLISELLIDNLPLQIEYLKSVKRETGIEQCNTILNTLIENTKELLNEKAYYKQVFNHNFDYVSDMNSKIADKHK